MSIPSCPKCCADFPEPLPESVSCPQCGVYFFKVLAARAASSPRSLAQDKRPPRDHSTRSGLGFLLVRLIRIVLLLALVLAGALWFFKRDIKQPHREVIETTQEPLPLLTPARSHSHAVAHVVESSVAVARPKIDPLEQRLRSIPDVMFNMQEEVYRIANANGIVLESVFFDGNERQATVGDGSRFSAAAFAMLRLQNGQRICSIRVIRPAADVSYAPGEKTTRWVTLNRRTTLAHELAHCVDWFNGWTGMPAGLPSPRDAIGEADQVKRWHEEFADLHAMALLKNTYGEDLARDAVAVRALIRIEAPIWYSHARVALNSQDSLQATSADSTRTLVARYWGQ